MTLLRDLRRLAVFVCAPLALSATLLAACGGGTSQVEAFRPSRLIVLGDENSAFSAATDANGKPDGFKYTINDRATSTTTGQCLLLPTAVQSLAAHYGFAFAECNVAQATPAAFSVAQPRAMVQDLATQLGDAKISGTALGASDMVSVWIGSNDVIALYEAVAAGTSSSAEAVLLAQQRGGAAAEAVNNILATGARAIVMTIPDLGLSPYALARKTSDPGAPALLSQLSYEFNAYLRTRIDSTRYDGRNYGLVLADDVVAAMNRSPTSFLSSPANAVDPACAVTAGSSDADAVNAALRACTTTNLVTPTGASATGANTHLWASDRHLGPNAHARIGSQAVSRASDNPF